MIEKTVLDNGVTVLTESLPDFNSAQVMIDVRVGSTDEDVETQGGVSHVLEHMMFKGTELRSREDIVGEIEGVGGAFNAFTSTDNTRYYANVPKDTIYTALDVLSDMVLNSKFDGDELERELEVIKQEILMRNDDNDIAAWTAHQEWMYGTTDYGNDVIGNAELVGTFKRDDIVEYYESKYSPDKMTVLCVGAVNHDEFVAEVSKQFEHIPNSASQSKEEEYDFGAGVQKVINDDIDQVHTRISFEGPTKYQGDDGRVLSLALLELGGGMSSRLFQNVRDARGLAYHVSIHASPEERVGAITAFIGTTPDKVVEAIDATMDEINQMRDEGLTEDEVTSLKKRLIGGFQMAQDNLGTKANLLLNQNRYRNEIMTADEIVARIDAITTDEVNETIQKYFPYSRDMLSITMFGPCGDISLDDVV